MTVKVTKPALNLREELSSLKKPSGVAGEAMLRAETPQEQFNLIGAGRKNILINGNFQVSQRGDYTTSSSVSTGYHLDRWKTIVSAGATLEHNLNVTLPDGSITNSALCTVTASGGYIALQQWVEDYKVVDGQDVTLSLWYRTNKSTCYLSIYDGSQQQYAGNKFIDDGEWHYFSHTFTIRSGITALRPEMWSATGGVSGQYFEIANVQLELGSVATPFEHRSYGEELALCQRYYVNLNPANLSYTRFGIWYATGTNNGYILSSLSVPLRAEPAVLYTNLNTIRITGPVTTTLTGLAYDRYSAGSSMISLYFTTGSGVSTGMAGGCDAGGYSSIYLDAEL